jgi:hypothetical protein
MPLRILASPLSIVRTYTPVVKLKGYSSLLTSSKSYVERNIKKRMALIAEAWEASKNIVSFGSRAHAFHEYLQANLKIEELFYLDFSLPFGNEVSNMMKLRIREGDLPSPSLIT